MKWHRQIESCDCWICAGAAMRKAYDEKQRAAVRKVYDDMQKNAADAAAKRLIDAKRVQRIVEGTRQREAAEKREDEARARAAVEAHNSWQILVVLMRTAAEVSRARGLWWLATLFGQLGAWHKSFLKEAPDAAVRGRLLELE